MLFKNVSIKNMVANIYIYIYIQDCVEHKTVVIFKSII